MRKCQKHLISDPVLARLAQMWAHKICFVVLALLIVKHYSKLSCYAISRNEMNETWENGEKPNFGPDFSLFRPNLGPKSFLRVLPQLVVRNCSNLSLYVISRKINEPNLRKWQKKLISDPILSCNPWNFINNENGQ